MYLERLFFTNGIPTPRLDKLTRALRTALIQQIFKRFYVAMEGQKNNIMYQNMYLEEWCRHRSRGGGSIQHSSFLKNNEDFYIQCFTATTF